MTITPPNPDILMIARRYLESYSLLADEDKIIFRPFLKALFSPPVIVELNHEAELVAQLQDRMTRGIPPIMENPQ